MKRLLLMILTAGFLLSLCAETIDSKIDSLLTAGSFYSSAKYGKMFIAREYWEKDTLDYESAVWLCAQFSLSFAMVNQNWADYSNEKAREKIKGVTCIAAPYESNGTQYILMIYTYNVYPGITKEKYEKSSHEQFFNMLRNKIRIYGSKVPLSRF